MTKIGKSLIHEALFVAIRLFPSYLFIIFVVTTERSLCSFRAM